MTERRPSNGSIQNPTKDDKSTLHRPFDAYHTRPSLRTFYRLPYTMRCIVMIKEYVDLYQALPRSQGLL